MFCEKCGRMLDEDDSICPLCHTVIRKNETEAEYCGNEKVSEKVLETIGVQVVYEPVYDDDSTDKSTKSRLAAGFLQIFLGGLGIGRFYLGYYGIGVMQLAASFFTCGLAGFVWGFVDGVRILCGYPEKDGMGKVLDY